MKLIGGESVKRVYSLNMRIMDVGNLLREMFVRITPPGARHFF